VPPDGNGVKLLVTEPADVPGPVRPTSASAPLTPEGKVAVRRMAGTDVSGIGTSNSAKVVCGRVNGAVALPTGSEPARATSG